MSGKGNCYDNAAMEVFFKTIKAELIWQHPWSLDWWLLCRSTGLAIRHAYQPKLSDENEQIADHLLALIKAMKMWGFGLCYLYLCNVRDLAGTIGAFIAFIMVIP